MGFTITGESNDDPSYGGHGLIGGVAEIRYGPNQRAAARLLSYYVPGSKLIETEQSRSAVIVALGRKFTKVASSQAVRRALRANAAAARPTTSAPPPTATAPPSTATATPSCAA
jgi:hypothetical protein